MLEDDLTELKVVALGMDDEEVGEGDKYVAMLTFSLSTMQIDLGFCLSR